MAKSKLDKMREQLEAATKIKEKIKFVEDNTDKISDSLCTAISKHDAGTVSASASIFTKNVNVFCDAIQKIQEANPDTEVAAKKVSDFEYALLKIIPMTADFCNEFERTAIDARFDKFVGECNEVIAQVRAQRGPQLSWKPETNNAATSASNPVPEQATNDATVSS